MENKTLYVFKYNPQLCIILDVNGCILERVTIPSYIPEEMIINHIKTIMVNRGYKITRLSYLGFDGYMSYKEGISTYSPSNISDNNITCKSCIVTAIIFNNKYVCIYTSDMSEKLLSVEYSSHNGVISDVSNRLSQSGFGEKYVEDYRYLVAVCFKAVH